MIAERILKLPTPRLLAYYKKHYQTATDYRMRFDAEFDAEREVIKTELNSREHLEK